MFIAFTCYPLTVQKVLKFIIKRFASLIIAACVCVPNLRERPLQPAAGRADDFPQRTEHLTQEVLHRGEET